MKTRLGRQETLLLAYAQMRKLRMLRMGELTGPLQLSGAQERELFRRLLRGGMIARVRPGLFLVPPRLPLGGAWTPSEAEALNALMADVKGHYQICGANTFNRYGFDDQIPNRVYAYNNRISGARKVGAVEMILIKVADGRLGDTETVTLPDGERAVYASRVRALVDAVYDWSRFNGIPRGYEWIRTELRAKRVSVAELVKCTLRYGDTGTIRRMGTLLEREGVDAALLRKLERALKPTSSTIPWIPSRPKRGTLNRRWGLVMNGSDPRT
jgi:predicted transcriptional regulator of viral defense system